MTEQAVDHRLIERAVGLIGVHVRDGQIRRDQLDRAFLIFQLDAQHRRLVEDGLATTGIRVSSVAPSSTADRSATAPGRAQSNPPLRGTRLADQSRRRAASVVPKVADAAEAARQVLRKDQHRRNPGGRLLTALEEVGLAQLLRAGQSLTEPLPSGFRRTLTDASEAAHAFDAMLLHNTGLVWSIARGYSPRGMEPDDLFQCGFIGLVRSVEMFDCTSGNKLSTYATWWIRQAITRAIANDSRLIRLPVHVHEKVMSVNRTYERLGMERIVVDVRDVADALDLTVAEVIECLRLARGVVSLDLPLGDDGGTSLGDLIEDRDNVDSHKVLSFSLLQDQLLSVLQTLSEREAGVIKLRFGLADGRARTLDEIGQVYGVTRERIRQIETKTMSKLRHHARSDVLRAYLD